MREITILVQKKLLELSEQLHVDLNDMFNVALKEYLEKRIVVCPFTNKFCINPDIPCNGCEITKKLK